jgi:hypothetical protein
MVKRKIFFLVFILIFSENILADENLFQTELSIDRDIIQIDDTFSIYIKIKNLSGEVQKINTDIFVYPSWKLSIRSDKNNSYIERDIYAEVLKMIAFNERLWEIQEEIRQKRTGSPPRPFPGYPQYITIEPGEEFVYPITCEYKLISYQSTEVYALIFDYDATRFIIPKELNEVLISFNLRIDESRRLDSDEVLLQFSKSTDWQ